MRIDGVDLLLNQLRIGSLLDQRVRELAIVEGLKETDVWIVVAMSGALGSQSVDATQGRSSACIANQLGFVRERVTMRIGALVKDKLVRCAALASSQDQRAKNYLLTPKGSRVGARLFQALCALERTARFEGRLKERARGVDPQRVACALWALGDQCNDLRIWLDRDRLPRAHRSIV